ncbi:multiprotein-bridging factor 1 family protein [Capnocytophaga canimorsus]|uniref:multiprotein-bridging factor 1 family protein n=1 Tax=Capnocytophaga canimorsus TaxID=28188 RepID=UPI0037CFBD73
MATEEIIKKRENVAKIIRNKRESMRLTQEELAQRVGFKANTILRIETCKFSPNADQLYMIAEALEIEITLDGEKI